MKTESFLIKGRQPCKKKLIESTEYFKYATHKARISRNFDLSKDAYPMKLEQGLQILVKLNFRELFDSKLSGLCSFDMVFSLSQKRGINTKTGCQFMRHQYSQ